MNTRSAATDRTPAEGDITAAPPPVGDAPGFDPPRTARRHPTGGWLVGPLLALVFLGYPIQTALVLDPTPARILLTLGGAALFGAVFVWLLWTCGPFVSGPPGPRELLERRAAVTFLAVLVVALNLGLARGPEWLVLFFHTSAAAGLVLPRRDAYVAVAALSMLAAVVGSRAELGFVALPTAAVGLWAVSFAGQVTALAELRVARDQLARRAVAEERLRFARDLHDLLGHSLSLIALKNELAGKLLPGDPERAAAEVRDAEVVARRALREVREAVAGYRQPTLAEELIEAREMLATAGVACRINSDAGPLSRRVDALLAWTVREGVTNVIRHSRARHCTVDVTRPARAVTVEIVDDGRGSAEAHRSVSSAARGSGLAGLAERVGEVEGAVFEAGPLPRGGFRLCVRLPIEELRR